MSSVQYPDKCPDCDGEWHDTYYEGVPGEYTKLMCRECKKVHTFYSEDY